MTDLTATNLSVTNAEKFVDSIKKEERILSFFIGGSTASSKNNLNLETEKENVFRDSSVFKKVSSNSVNIVSKYVSWKRSSAYKTWNTNDTPTGNYYVINNGKVYLVVANDDLNRVEYDGSIPVSVAPTHTSGFQKYSDGYEYLFMYGISAQDKATVNNSSWVNVPETISSDLAGKLIYQKINLSAISEQNKIISHKDPTIPILSDSGSGAAIKLETVVVSSPYATESNKLYKIVGLKVVSRGNVEYRDFNIEESLKSVLKTESSSKLTEISNAISLGFVSSEGLSYRETLQSKYALINCQIGSDEISAISDQKQFFRFGVHEDLLEDDGSKVFTRTKDTVKSNNIKISLAAVTAVTPEADDFLLGETVEFSNKTKYSPGISVAARDLNVFTTKVEIQAKDKNLYETGDIIKKPKDPNTTFIVTSVEKPTIKQYSGRSLHIGATRFSFTESQLNKKMFVGQIIQRF